MSFRLTYSTMFDPPPELHERFETAVENVRSTFGQSYGHYIDGADVIACSVENNLRVAGANISTEEMVSTFLMMI